MNEQSEGIPPPEMDEPKTLGQIINEIGSEKPDLAEAFRLCAIPHWFNKEILAWLRGEGHKPSERTEAILDELKLRRLAFVRLPSDQTYEVHENVRNPLLRRWRYENAERFRELSGKTAAYCADMMRSEKSSEEQRAGWEREEMYHLLVADQERGIDRFISLANSAIDTYRLSTLDHLLRMAGEQADELSPGNRLWIQFFEGKKNIVSGHWEKAIEIWERLKGEKAHSTPDLEKTLGVDLSILYKDKGEWDKAIECFQDSLNIFENAGDEKGMATILNNRGFLYKDKGEWKKAEEDFESAHRKLEKIGDERGMAISLKNLALLHKDNKKWDEAIKCFEDSLAILARVGDKRGMANTHNDRGILYKDRGLLYKDKEDWKKAEDDFQSALKILEKIGDEHGQAAAFNSLGFLYQDREDWEKAENAFQSARKILEKIGDERRKADTFSYLGNLYRDKGEWRQAHDQFEYALTILKEMEDERGKAAILNNLGLLYQRKGERETAADYFRQSLQIVEKVGDEMNAATTMYELALLYEDMEEYGEAIELLEKVVKISEQVGHPDLRIGKSREKLEMVKKKEEE